MASTLAGNFTVLGSIANLIVVQRAGARGVAIGFWDYFRVGAPLTILTLVIGDAVAGLGSPQGGGLKSALRRYAAGCRADFSPPSHTCERTRVVWPLIVFWRSMALAMTTSFRMTAVRRSGRHGPAAR